MGLHLSSAPEALLPSGCVLGAYPQPGLVGLGAVSCPWAALALPHAWAVDDPAVAAPRRSLLMWGQEQEPPHPEYVLGSVGKVQKQGSSSKGGKKGQPKGLSAHRRAGLFKDSILESSSRCPVSFGEG